MSQAKLILLADVPALGTLGDIVSVRGGYARNWLLPRKLAIRHSTEAFAGFAARKAAILKERAEQRTAAEKLHEQLSGYLLQVTVRSGPEGKLYGSIGQTQIVEDLRKQGYEVSRTQVKLPDGEPIKTIGDHDISVAVTPELIAPVKLSVLADRDH